MNQDQVNMALAMKRFTPELVALGMVTILRSEGERSGNSFDSWEEEEYAAMLVRIRETMFRPTCTCGKCGVRKNGEG